MATASWARSGSRVVSFWSCIPGAMSARAHARWRLRPNHLSTSNESPATSGMPTTRESSSQYQAGVPSGAKTTTATIITMSRKLVPQRGCSRLKRCASSGTSGRPAS